MDCVCVGVFGVMLGCMSMEMKITNVEPTGPTEKHAVEGAKKVIWCQRCQMTTEDGAVHPCDVTASKKKGLETQRLSMVQCGWYDPQLRMISMRYGLC